jgi:hypothetical protein
MSGCTPRRMKMLPQRRGVTEASQEKSLCLCASVAIDKGIAHVLEHATTHENEPPRSQRPQSPVFSLRTLRALR